MAPANPPDPEAKLNEITVEQFQAAIAAGVAGGMGATGEQKKKTPIEEGGGSSVKISTEEAESFVSKAFSFAGRSIEGMSSMGMTALSELYAQMDDLGKRSRAMEEELGYFYQARKEFGNISIDAVKNGEKIKGVAGDYIRTFEAIYKSATDSITETNLEFTDGYDKALDPMYNYFESAEEAAGLYASIMSEIGSETPKILKELNEEESKRLTFFSKTLDIAERDVSAIIRRQYAFTGEASDEILGQIGTVSKSLSDTTGMNAQQLKRGIVEVMSDVDKFGNIGVDAAGRISAALTQLGVDFQSFQRLTDQFMNFDSAANKMGELSALFGIQLDAMEMTYLANEDQEEFLFRMREEIMDTGIDVENMSNARARALAGQLNMSVTEMKTFLREGELAVGQMEMEGATTAADSMDALTVAGRDFGNEFERSAQTAEEALKEKLKRSIIETRNEAVGLRDELNQTATAAQKIQIPDSITNVRGQYTKLRTEFQATQTSIYEAGTKLFQASSEALGKAVNEEIIKNLNSFEAKMNYYNNTVIPGLEKQAKNAANVTSYGSATNPNSINIKNKVFKEAEVQKVQNEQRLGEVLKAQGITQGQVDAIVSAMKDQNKVLNLQVDLDGDTVADKTYKVLINEGKLVTSEVEQG